MRLLTFILFAFALTGCVKSPHHSDSARLSADSAANTTTGARDTMLHSRAPAAPRLLNNLDQLAGKPFLTLGTVTGEGCQVNAQDFPTDMTVVRNQLRANAQKLNANVVMLNRCEIHSAQPGCYRQTQCTGSALRVAQ